MKDGKKSIPYPGRPWAVIVPAILVLFLASCASAPLPRAESEFATGGWTGSMLVRTKYGDILGRADERNTIAWRGIPYAAPPVGDLRWKAPRKPDPWKGTLEAYSFGNAPVQQGRIMHIPVGSEDCLYLNVWRPDTTETGLPVYFWIYGGGNTSGSAGDIPDYHGDALASKANIVFVSINYRVGVLGWFSHPALRTGTDPESDSGNFGTLDIIEALRWVRDNISAFGGNPDNMTIAGESAGAFNVLSLLIAPAAKGLFRQAVSQSGYQRGYDRESADAFAEDLVNSLLVNQGKARTPSEAKALASSMSKEELASLLRKASPGQLLSLMKKAPSGLTKLAYPILDGTVFPTDGFAALKDPARCADVPLMVGTNAEESKLFQWSLGMNFREPFYQPLARLASSVWKAQGADSIADSLAAGEGRQPVYLYRFDWGAPDAQGKSVLPGRNGERLGAAHTLDISFFLGSQSILNKYFPLLFTKANEKGRKALRDDILVYLSSFMRCGNPNSPVQPYRSLPLPYWEPWSADSADPPFMVLDAGLKESRVHPEYGRVTIGDVEKMLMGDYGEPMRSRLERQLVLLSMQ